MLNNENHNPIVKPLFGDAKSKGKRHNQGIIVTWPHNADPFYCEACKTVLTL